VDLVTHEIGIGTSEVDELEDAQTLLLPGRFE
jgi:hypothetical protein